MLYLRNTLLAATVMFTLLAVLLGASPSYGVIIVDTSYTTNTTVSTDHFLSDADATWTIDPGVTVTSVRSPAPWQYTRFYIELSSASGSSTFTIAGGGTFVHDSTTVRLGLSPGYGTGTLAISDGSTFQMTYSARDIFGGRGDGGFLDLADVGSTFSASGVYNPTTKEFEGFGFGNPASGAPLGVPVSVTGGILLVSTDGTFTTLTVGAVPIPEPSTFLLAALGLLGLGFFGRRRCREPRQRH